MIIIKKKPRIQEDFLNLQVKKLRHRGLITCLKVIVGDEPGVELSA